jgi:hypothetical protein
VNARGIPSVQYTQTNQLEGLQRMQHNVDNPPMFEGFSDPVVSESEKTTVGERRRRRQAAAVAAGYHPLHLVVVGVRLHPEANLDAPVGTRSAPFTCGSCVHRFNVGGNAKSYPKCDVPGRASHSEATDVKSSWPACMEYVPSE